VLARGLNTQHEDDEAAAAREARHLLVFYASQTGNALGVARLLVKQARANGFDATLCDLGKADRVCLPTCACAPSHVLAVML